MWTGLHSWEFGRRKAGYQALRAVRSTEIQKSQPKQFLFSFKEAVSNNLPRYLLKQSVSKMDQRECGKILTLGGAAESCMAPEK